METPCHMPVDMAATERHGLRVAADIADMPVTDAELDAIEAFLMKQFRAVMAGESIAAVDLILAPDSEPPQTHARIRASGRGWKKSRGNMR